VWKRLNNRQVLGLLAASLFTFIILFGPQITFLPILMDERFGAPSFLRGVVLSCASLITAVTSSQLGNLTGRFSGRNLLRAAFVLYALSLTGVAFAPHLWLLFVTSAVFGIAQGINIPNVFSLLNSIAPSENRGAFMSINGMTLRAGQTLGPLFMASAYGSLGFTGAYLAAAALAVLTFVLVLALVR
jgi:MFS family permease